MSLTLFLNSSSIAEARLVINARSRDGVPSEERYTFIRNATIEIRQPELTTFIETDKSVYKPSDTGNVDRSIF